MNESIYNVDELIKQLINIKNEIGQNAEVYIKDTYSTGGEYLRITNIEIDDNDIVLTSNKD